MDNKIRELREEKKLSQGQLANLCYCSRITISNLERKVYSPSLELSFRIAKVLGVNIYTLFFKEEDLII